MLGPAVALGQSDFESTPRELPPEALVAAVEVENPAFPSPSTLVALGRRFEERDLALYFAEGDLAKAKESFDRGRYAEARDLLRSAGTHVSARYLAALAALRSGDHERAGAEFEDLAEEYRTMRDRCLAHAGEAFLAIDRWKDAARVFARVPKESRRFPDARMGLFAATRALGDRKAANEALLPLVDLGAPAWGRDVGADALWALAELARERADEKAHRTLLLRLWSEHPLDPAARQAEVRLKGTKPPVDALVTRAEQLIEGHRNRSGIEILAPLLPSLKPPATIACRAHFAYGKALRKERQHLKAIAALETTADACKDPGLRPRILYVLASSRSIVDAPAGIATYERLAKDYPDHAFADDALYYAADLYLRAGKTDLALARLQDLAEKYPKGDFAAEGLFKSFWIHRARKDAVRAVADLDRIESTYRTAEETYEVERARYWRARTQEEGGARDQAVEGFEALAVDHPATYYGLMARSRLARLEPDRLAQLSGRLIFPTTVRSIFPVYGSGLENDPHFSSAVELFRLGLREAVPAEIWATNRTGRPPAALRLLVWMLSEAGDSKSAHALARTQLRSDLAGRITYENRMVWELAYPRAFRDLIEEHCKAAEVEPDLLQALMREESALDPRALSWAGALGLTQLMLPTAKAVAVSLGIRRVTESQLYDPSLNIRLGSYYLGTLLKRFRGEKALALAGYNAGGGAVSRWRSAKPSGELDEWVEEIPISETRGYVKRVLRSYNTYQLLYPGAPVKSASKARWNGSGWPWKT